MAATVKMAKTQPLLTVPVAQPIATPVVIPAAEPNESTSDTLALLEAVPLPLCWVIFGISTVTLLIQIWNYFSS